MTPHKNKTTSTKEKPNAANILSRHDIESTAKLLHDLNTPMSNGFIMTKRQHFKELKEFGENLSWKKIFYTIPLNHHNFPESRLMILRTKTSR